jgi:hypothetical protein
MPQTLSHSAPPDLAFGGMPPEMRLLLACARWPPSEQDAASVRTLAAAGPVQWEQFLLLCAHHRVAPLVYRALTTAGAALPPAIAAELKKLATDNAVNAFRYLAETRRLCDLLQQAGVPVRVLKGVALSQRVFRDPSLRDVGDIDLLIAPGMEETADRILLADGFRRSDPAARLTPARRRSWRRHGKDYTYFAQHSGFELDLHWRLFRNPYMPGNALADPESAPSERVQLGETALAALPLERSFLHLCVHGALDGWFRLKSLVDIAALWSGFTSERRDAVTACARDYHIVPELAAALTLAQQLALLDADALAPAMQLQADGREARWIMEYAQTQLNAQHFRPMPEKVGSWPLKRYELGLRRSLPYRLEVVRRVMFRPRVWERFDLPDMLFPLYAVLSPLEWILFHQEDPASGPATGRRVSRWQRWRALRSPERKLLIEAFGSLFIARAALALLPIRWIFRWLERPNRLSPGIQVTGDAAEHVRWSILAAARYGPLQFVCFPQALAAHAMLRRRGIRSVMHYGVRRSIDRRLRAHTWLEVDHRMLLGGESAVLFAPIHSSGNNTGPEGKPE